MKKVNLSHRSLDSKEQRILSQAVDQGWLLARGSTESRKRQIGAWFLICYENSADCLVFEMRGRELWLSTTKMARMPLSRIFGQEKAELCRQWGLDDTTEARVPPGLDLEQLAKEILALYARDRTEARTLQIQRTAREGMAEVVEPSKYWPDLDLGQHAYAYIIPIPGKPSRCVALRHRELPLVDVPLEDFRLVHEES